MGNLDIEIELLSYKDNIWYNGCNRELFVNHILFIAKKYIYSCRCDKTKPSIIVLNATIKMINRLEMINGRQILWQVTHPSQQMGQVYRKLMLL